MSADYRHMQKHSARKVNSKGAMAIGGAAPLRSDSKLNASTRSRRTELWSTNKWLNHTSNQIQVALGHIYFCASPCEVNGVLDQLVPPRTPLERILARGVVFEAIENMCSTSGETRNRSRAEFGVAAVLGDPFLALGRALAFALRERNDKPRNSTDNIRAYIDVHYAAKLTAFEVARTFGVTVPELNRRFRESTKMTFKKYLMWVRLCEGVKLIHGGAKVEAAAFSVGYHAKGPFYHACKRYLGLSPTQLARNGAAVPREKLIPNAWK